MGVTENPVTHSYRPREYSRKPSAFNTYINSYCITRHGFTSRAIVWFNTKADMYTYRHLCFDY